MLHLMSKEKSKMDPIVVCEGLFLAATLESF